MIILLTLVFKCIKHKLQMQRWTKKCTETLFYFNSTRKKLLWLTNKEANYSLTIFRSNTTMAYKRKRLLNCSAQGDLQAANTTGVMVKAAHLDCNNYHQASHVLRSFHCNTDTLASWENSLFYNSCLSNKLCFI